MKRATERSPKGADRNLIPRGLQMRLPLVFIAIVAAALALATQWLAPDAFRRFLGNAPVLLVFLLAAAALLTLDPQLSKRGWPSSSFRSQDDRHFLPWLCLSLALGAVAIVIDRLHPFPEDINVPFPASLLFYPAIAFLVEIVFHVLPVAAVSSVLRSWSENRASWTTIALVSLMEPAFQVIAGLDAPAPLWKHLWVAMHVLGINLAQLYLFKTQGFLSMYFFRLGYYAVWHVAWGYLRLAL